MKQHSSALVNLLTNSPILRYHERKQCMSILTKAQKKVTHGNMSKAFKNEEGAIDLASIMVGIIVIGLIGGVIAATVFAVIPWAQDNAAKQQLDAVNTAQSAKAGLNDGKYSANLGTFLDTSAAKVILRSDESSCFGAFVTSASGATFYTSSTKTQPTKINAQSAWPTKPSTYPTNCSWPSTKESASIPSSVSYSLNSSFESSDLSMMANIGGGNKTLERLASPTAHSGEYVYRVTANVDNTTGFGYGSFSAPLEPGNYVISVRVRASSSTTIRPWMESSPGTATQQSPAQNSGNVITGSPDEWQTLWMNVNVIDNGTKLKTGFLKGSVANTGDWIEMDSVQVVKATGNNILDATYSG
jgi:type II secretory pathway pseudopilin PulG